MKTKGTRSLRKGDRSVLLPGAIAAEPWELWSLGAAPECLRTCASPRDYSGGPGSVLALPVGQVFCLPLWLQETDAKQFGGMIALQLETRGLQPRAGAVFDWSIVAQEEARTLVMVGVLPAVLSPGLEDNRYAGFDLSARYLPLPADAVTLWLEQDQLVSAFTRGSALVYFQALGEAQITPRLLQDLNCVRATLAMQDVLPGLGGGLVLWHRLPAEELAALRTAVPLSVQQAEKPLPRPPAAPWKLTPSAVATQKKTREANRWRWRLAALVLLLYVCFVGFLGVRYALLARRVAEQRRWQAEHAQALSLVRTTAAQWRDLRPFVDRDFYPLEVLLHVAGSIPHDQLHLTLFEVTNEHLLIKGEAKNVAAAFKFLDQLKADPAFAGYDFQMPQPHILPNDLAQLQIDSARPPPPAP